MRSQRLLPVVVLVGLAVPARLTAQPPAAAPAAAPAVTPASTADARTIFHDILTQFYQAYGRKDLPAVEALWHPNGPIRGVRNILEVDFEMRTLTLVDLVVTEASIDAGGGRARALVDLDVVAGKTGRARRLRWVREWTFLQDGAAWKMWNDSSISLAGQIARRLSSTPPAERDALIAADPEVRSEDTLAGLQQLATYSRSRGNLTETVDLLGTRAALARALGSERELATSLLDLGLVLQVLGRQADAGTAFAEGRDLLTRVGSTSEVAIMDGNLGSVEYLLGHYETAAVRYRQALEVFDREKDDARAGGALHSLGNALYMLGDLEPAMAAYQRCLAIHQAAKNQYAASAVLQAIALVHKEAGSYSAAADAYARSVTASLAADDSLGAARGEHGLGEMARLSGDYARALQHLAASLALWQKTLDPGGRAGTLYTTGQVHAARRDFARAIESYQQALDTDRKAADQAGVARDLGGMGGAHFGQGQLPTALEEYRASMAIREQLKDMPGVMWTVVHMGVLHTAMGNHAEALASYQRALSLAEPAGDAGAVCTILALRAANELRREDAEAALATAGKAAEMAERLQLFDVLAQARLVAGKAHRTAGRTDEALAMLLTAVAALEQVPVGPGVESFFDDRRGPYTALVDLLVSERRVADAFRWSERARLRQLAALLGGDGAVVTRGLTDQERDEERRLAREVRTLLVRLKRERGRAEPDAAKLESVQQQCTRALEAKAAYRRTLFETHPALVTLRAQQEPAGLERAAEVLSPTEALVSFVMTEAGVTAFVAAQGSAGGLRTSAMPIDVKPVALAARVLAMREAIERRERRADEIARELYDLLIAPIREALGSAHTLIVVPDGILWSLPFEALRAESGRYLVQDLAVSYTSSLTALATGRSGAAERRPRASLVAAADPSLAPAAMERLKLVQSSEVNAAPAGRDARHAALLFGPTASRLFARADSRLDRVAARLDPSTALHLAVPGVLLDTSPLFSLLAMAPAGQDDPDSGLVEVSDLLNLAIPAEVVVLPLVEQGRNSSGDASIALAWSLRVAGTPAAVVSRWVPGPAAPGGLVPAFYEAWLKGTGPKAARRSASDALQKAMRAMAARPGTTIADWARLMVVE